MKVAIVGAGGFLGSRAIEYLYLTGKAEVRAVVRKYSALARLSRFDLEWHLSDATDETGLAAAFRGVDCVLHSIMGDDNAIKHCAHPAYMAAERAGVKRIVFISSAAVYGPTPRDSADETTKLSIRSLGPYASAKLQTERHFLDLARKGNVEVVVLRPSIIIGPRSPWVAIPCQQILSKAVPLYRGGNGICNSIYVDNLLDAILAACNVKGINGRVFLIGDDGCISWRELYLTFARLLAITPVFYESAISETSIILDSARKSQLLKQASLLLSPLGKNVVRRLLGLNTETTLSSDAKHRSISPDVAALHVNNWRLQSHRAKKELGYAPSLSVSEGLARSVAWFRYASPGSAEQ